MPNHNDMKLLDLGGQLTRRKAVQTYAPPAIASIGALSVATFKHSGGGGPKHPNSGRGNGPEGNPDQDPGNSGGHNKANDGGSDPGRRPGKH